MKKYGSGTLAKSLRSTATSENPCGVDLSRISECRRSEYAFCALLSVRNVRLSTRNQLPSYVAARFLRSRLVV
jgi:hypothetical protein